MTQIRGFPFPKELLRSKQQEEQEGKSNSKNSKNAAQFVPSSTVRQSGAENPISRDKLIQPIQFNAHQNGNRWNAFSSKGDLLAAVSYEGRVTCHEVASLKIRFDDDRKLFSSSMIFSCEFNPFRIGQFDTDELIVLSGADGKVMLVKSSDGEKVLKLDTLGTGASGNTWFRATFSPASGQYVLACADLGQFAIFDVGSALSANTKQTVSPVATLATSKSVTLMSCAFISEVVSEKKMMIAVAGASIGIEFWSIEFSNQQAASSKLLFSIPSDARVNRLDVVKKQSSQGAEDDKKLVLGCTEKGKLFLVDAESKSLIFCKSFSNAAFYNCVFSQKGKFAFVAGSDSEVYVVRLEDQAVICKLTDATPGFTVSKQGEVEKATFSAYSCFVALAINKVGTLVSAGAMNGWHFLFSVPFLDDCFETRLPVFLIQQKGNEKKNRIVSLFQAEYVPFRSVVSYL